MMDRADERGVTDVIGFILVFGLVATTVAIISINGMGTLQDSRDAEQVNNAERAYDVLADNMADVYQEGAPHRATEISLEKAQLNTATTVRLNVSGVDSSDNYYPIKDVRAQPIVWESTEATQSTIAYSFGAVVRADRQGGVIVNEPPFVLEDDRMILMAVKTQTTEPQSMSGTTVRVRGSKAQSGSTVRTDQLDAYSRLEINVTTPRAAIWKRYFERKDVTTSCSIDEETGRERVSCEISPPPDQLYVTVSSIDVEVEG